MMKRTHVLLRNASIIFIFLAYLNGWREVIPAQFVTRFVWETHRHYNLCIPFALLHFGIDLFILKMDTIKIPLASTLTWQKFILTFSLVA